MGSVKWKQKRDPLDRVMDKVQRTADGCWQVKPGPNGYGVLGVEGRTLYAHRYVYERLVGPIPAGLVIDHLCRNRACCNPEHLEPVTQRENCLRGARAGSRVPECKRGHAYDDENTALTGQGYRYCRTCQRLRKGRAAA